MQSVRYGHDPHTLMVHIRIHRDHCATERDVWNVRVLGWRRYTVDRELPKSKEHENRGAIKDDRWMDCSRRGEKENYLTISRRE